MRTRVVCLAPGPALLCARRPAMVDGCSAGRAEAEAAAVRATSGSTLRRRSDLRRPRGLDDPDVALHSGAALSAQRRRRDAACAHVPAPPATRTSEGRACSPRPWDSSLYEGFGGSAAHTVVIMRRHQPARVLSRPLAADVRPGRFGMGTAEIDYVHRAVRLAPGWRASAASVAELHRSDALHLACRNDDADYVCRRVRLVAPDGSRIAFAPSIGALRSTLDPPMA